MRRFLVACAIVAGLLTVAGPAGGTRAATIHFSFHGYVNNVKVVAPLVSRTQLGVARVRGSGTLVQNQVRGVIVGVTKPLDSHQTPASMRARVLGYYFQATPGDYTLLTLTIEIVSAVGGGPHCTAGTRGVITLYDSVDKLPNGESSDYITIGRWSGNKCPGFVQGWTNRNGGARTRPSRGGPPNGGQWAVVAVSSS